MKIKPRNNQILAEGIKRSAKGGIILEDEYEDYYKVLAVGSEVQAVEKNDLIVILNHSAHQHEDYLLVSEDNVIAKVTE